MPTEASPTLLVIPAISPGGSYEAFFFQQQQLLVSSLPSAKVMVIESARCSGHAYGTIAGQAAA